MNDGQLDLFGFVAEPAEPEVKAPSPDCSRNGLVHFKYNPLLKKSIRCKGGFLFGHPEVLLPAYMKAPEFADARELAAEWAEHAVRRKTQKNKAIIKDLVNRFWLAVDQIFTDKGEAPLASKGRLPPIRPQGTHHNLTDVLAAINNTYFDGTLTCKITWSNRVGGLSFHSVRKDPVTGESFGAGAALCMGGSSASVKNVTSITMNGSSGTRKSCPATSAPCGTTRPCDN